jgi:hypothetical protein
MSVLSLKADIHQRGLHVRLVPKRTFWRLSPRCLLSNRAVEGLTVTGMPEAPQHWIPEPPGNACERIELRFSACFWEHE